MQVTFGCCYHKAGDYATLVHLKLQVEQEQGIV
jgi:hypothetical protein